MQTLSDSLTTYPRALKAANEDYSAAAGVDKNDRPSATAGWDPYEVWRTRVMTKDSTPNPNPRVR